MRARGTRNQVELHQNLHEQRGTAGQGAGGPGAGLSLSLSFLALFVVPNSLILGYDSCMIQKVFLVEPYRFFDLPRGFSFLVYVFIFGGGVVDVSLFELLA
jgi:hypothetical protein